MKLFNTSFRTKSVGIATCFIGGSKAMNAYEAYDKFNNPLLEKLSYPIINLGTLHKPTFSGTDLAKYFSLINKTPPDYTAIADAFRMYDVDNYVSIKLPHTSWFSPVELKNKTVTLSQIDMSTRKKPLAITPDKIMILGANYVPETIKLKSNTIVSLDKLPVFLPSNYHNQNYLFNSLDFSNMPESTELFQVLSKMIFKNIKVQEPIRFLFKEIKIGSKVYKNVDCNTGIGYEAPQATLAYENQNGEIKYHYWLMDQLPETLEHAQREDIDKTVYDQIINDAEREIQSSVSHSSSPTFRIENNQPIYSPLNEPSALHPDFLEKLSHKLETPTSQVVATEPLQQKDINLLDKTLQKYSKDPSKLETIENYKHLENLHLKIGNEIEKHSKVSDRQHIVDHLQALQRKTSMQLRQKFKDSYMQEQNIREQRVKTQLSTQEQQTMQEQRTNMQNNQNRLRERSMPAKRAYA